jgi:hypothetical protein
MLEMKLVLSTIFERNEILVGHEGLELSRRRAITLSPGRGAETVLGDRALVAA